MRDVDQGRFYLPDAEEGKRETIVTTAVDAQPVQCLQLPGPSFVTFWAALTNGGFFIFGTYHLWWLAVISAVLALGFICFWLWTGTAAIPTQESKDVGLGVQLPLYVSGYASVGWWAMFITMLADLTSFASLVFGYFFYWTIRADFPPDPTLGPGIFWPCLAAALLLGAWAIARPDFMRAGCCGRARGNRWRRAARGSLVDRARPENSCLSSDGMGPGDLDRVPLIMQLYCLVRRLGGRMTARHDIDIDNVALYWHFIAITIVVTVIVIAGFPLVK
jgi:cytochrome c oxidase subunit I+III